MPAPVISIAEMREWERITWASGQTEAEVIRRVGACVGRCAARITHPGERILILAGILTKPACVALAIEMAIIVWGLPAPHGGLFWGHSFEFFLLLALLSLYIGGPGKYSLARLWLNRKGKA